MPEEVSEDEVSEQTSITIERKPEQRRPIEFIIDTRREPEESQTEVTKTVTETVTTETETVTTAVTEEESDEEFPEYEVIVMPGEKPEEAIVETIERVTETVTMVTELAPDEEVSESVEVVIAPVAEIPSSSEEELEYEKPELQRPLQELYPEDISEAPEDISPHRILPEHAAPKEVPEEETVVKLLPPEVLKELTNVDVSVGEEVHLECQIIGQPRPTVEWLCDGSPVQGRRFVSVSEKDGTNLLMISPVLESDDAEFECRATNPEGTISSTADVFVGDRSRKEVEVTKKTPRFAPVELEVAPDDKPIEEVSERTKVTIDKMPQKLPEISMEIYKAPQETF